MTCQNPALPPARARLCARYRHLALWTFQGWLAMFFIAAGYAKLTEPMRNLIALSGWPAQAPEAVVRALGGLEMGLALGLLAPLISWRAGRPVLLMAAAGLAALEIAMLAVHALRLEPGLAGVNLALLALTAPVLMGRRASRDVRP